MFAPRGPTFSGFSSVGTSATLIESAQNIPQLLSVLDSDVVELPQLPI
jgi:hypothetical protein